MAAPVRLGDDGVTARQRGKCFERTVAELFNGKRQPLTGLPGPDVITRTGLVIECKRVDEAGIRGAWLEQARGHGRRHDAPWLLVKAVKGSQLSVTVMDTRFAVQLLRTAGLLDTAAKEGGSDA